MDKVNISIDGHKLQVDQGITVLEAAKEVGIIIPTLCYLKGINRVGACRVCLVEVEGSRTLQAACVYPVTEGMVVYTNTEKVRRARKLAVELLISNHPMDCLACVRNQNCELQAVARQLNILDVRYEGERLTVPEDTKSVAVHREPEKCIHCYRCVSMCGKVQTAFVYSAVNRGFNSYMAPAFNNSLADVACITCGQCIMVCPTAALREKDDSDKVWAALADPDKYVIVQTAPSIRVSLGEEFGFPTGHRVTGKMVAALRRLGFKKVFDTDLSADLTIVAEGMEFLDKLEKGGPFPHLSSCSPGWIKFCEHFYPEFLPNVSTVKSPHSMFGALAKTYYAEKAGLDPAKLVVVSVMPCTAKKYEMERPEHSDSGYKDVDVTLTTREIARMIREAGIDFARLPDEDFDEPMGLSTGAGALFGATGGVLEASLRTIYELTTNKDFDHEVAPWVPAVRGMDGIKETTVVLPQGEVHFAVTHGTGNARVLLDKVRKGDKNYHFVELMGCPGGCVGGGGQPILTHVHRWEKENDYRIDRADGLYQEDRAMNLRRSHHNPAVKAIYQWLGGPLSEKAHRLLHTHYTPRGKYSG